MKKVKINIAGSEYKIITDKDILHVKRLAGEINSNILLYQNKNPDLTINNIFILMLLEYLDNYKDIKKSEDCLKNKIEQYIKESEETKTKINELKQEIDRLKNKNRGKNHYVKDNIRS